ncbi:hypothetical protein BV372_30915 [Nostoc sp. T09]|uniref:response regulator n=1 Tax=Nostoc sp. T09 TaxID=1932621 RepID=UPI000A3AC195|nr:response regulator [Nostoc sp. T09]OUL22131.1 hypothetical protein BV372_30915 [Nostoc sp. T09]
MNDKKKAQATILLIEQDDETRPLLRYNLYSHGFRAIVALDEEDAIARACYERDRPNLILLNQVDLSIPQFIKMGQRIRQNAVLPSHTPIVVMAEEYGIDMEGKNVKVGDSEYVVYLEDAQQLINFLRHLCFVHTQPQLEN